MRLEDFISGRYKQQFKYKSFTPNKINKEFTWDNTDINISLEEANKSLAELNAVATFIPNINLFIAMYSNTEAIFSTRIEGTRTEMDELLNNNFSDEETRNDKQEVQNYINALNYAIGKLSELLISNRLLKETHGVLMYNARGQNKYPGEFRKTQNWIGGSNLIDAFYIPPHQDEIEELMADLENFIHNNNLKVPHLIKIAIIHYQFESIHPFCDGNGRLGRLLIILYLINFRLLDKPILYLSYFFEKYKATYYDYLTNVRKNNEIIKWILFFLNGVIKVSKQAKNTLNNINNLKKEIEELISTKIKRKSKNLIRLLDYIFVKPIVNVDEIIKNLNLNKMTAYNLIYKLEELNILREITDKQRNKVYKFEKYLVLFKNIGY